MTDYEALLRMLDGSSVNLPMTGHLYREAATAIRGLRGEMDEARALQREYRGAQLLAENDAAMVRAVWKDVEAKLRAQLDAAQRDAERYRWLRLHAHAKTPESELDAPEQFDANVDEGIAFQKTR